MIFYQYFLVFLLGSVAVFATQAQYYDAGNFSVAALQKDKNQTIFSYDKAKQKIEEVGKFTYSLEYKGKSQVVNTFSMKRNTASYPMTTTYHLDPQFIKVSVQQDTWAPLGYEDFTLSSQPYIFNDFHFHNIDLQEVKFSFQVHLEKLNKNASFTKETENGYTIISNGTISLIFLESLQVIWNAQSQKMSFELTLKQHEKQTIQMGCIVEKGNPVSFKNRIMERYLMMRQNTLNFKKYHARLDNKELVKEYRKNLGKVLFEESIKENPNSPTYFSSTYWSSFPIYTFWKSREKELIQQSLIYYDSLFVKSNYSPEKVFSERNYLLLRMLRYTFSGDAKKYTKTFEKNLEVYLSDLPLLHKSISQNIERQVQFKALYHQAMRWSEQRKDSTGQKYFETGFSKIQLKENQIPDDLFMYGLLFDIWEKDIVKRRMIKISNTQNQDAQGWVTTSKIKSDKALQQTYNYLYAWQAQVQGRNNEAKAIFSKTLPLINTESKCTKKTKKALSFLQVLQCQRTSVLFMALANSFSK